MYHFLIECENTEPRGLKQDVEATDRSEAFDICYRAMQRRGFKVSAIWRVWKAQWITSKFSYPCNVTKI